MQAVRTLPVSRRAEPSQPCILEGHGPLDNLLTLVGAQIIGNNAAWLLLGFLIAQTYTYYIRSTKDSAILKIFVYGLVAFSAVGDTAAQSYINWVYLVSGWGNSLRKVDRMVPLFVQQDLQIIFDAVPAFAVQLFFTWRIWKFCLAVWGRTTKRFVAAICLLIILMSICAFTSAIFNFINALASSETKILANQVSLLSWAISTAVADVMITICMMVVLYHAKSSAHNGDTRDKISRMLRLTIQTGFLTSVLAIPIVPLFASKVDAWNGFTWYLLSKSYTMTLLANLNARPSTQPAAGQGDSSHLSTLSFTPGQVPPTNATYASSGNRTMGSLTRSATHVAHPVLTASRVENKEIQPDNGETSVTEPRGSGSEQTDSSS